MTDIVTLPGTGEDIAVDDIGGIQFQVMKLIHGDNGVNDGLVSSTNGLPVEAIGELIEAIEAMRMAVNSLTRSIGQSMPDTAGRLRVVIDAITGLLTLSTITTVSTLTNQTQVGGNPAFEQIPSLMRIGADSLRRNITAA
jgi:hypothetical protein